MCSTEAGHAELLEMIQSVSVHGRAPKQEPTLLALAAAIVHAPTPAAKSLALDAMSVVARIPTHLFALLGHVTSMSQAAHNSKGWGRGMRRAVSDWYTSKSGRELAMQMTKYKNREGWTHQDVLRMVHVGPTCLKDDGARLAMTFAIKGEEAYAAEYEKLPEAPADPESVAAVRRLITGITAVAAEGVTGADAARLIREHGLVREHLPTTLLDSAEVWKALLMSGHGMPMEAMVRNLSKMTAVGLLEEQECADWVVARLTNADAIRASRIHPMKLLMASRQYQRGHGDKGKLSWSPERRVVQRPGTGPEPRILASTVRNFPPPRVAIFRRMAVSSSLVFSVINAKRLDEAPECVKAHTCSGSSLGLGRITPIHPITTPFGLMMGVPTCVMPTRLPVCTFSPM
jgi:60 kDa SS-A/Ro ribonucleoprotein